MMNAAMISSREDFAYQDPSPRPSLFMDDIRRKGGEQQKGESASMTATPANQAATQVMSRDCGPEMAKISTNQNQTTSGDGNGGHAPPFPFRYPPKTWPQIVTLITPLTNSSPVAVTTLIGYTIGCITSAKLQECRQNLRRVAGAPSEDITNSIRRPQIFYNTNDDTANDTTNCNTDSANTIEEGSDMINEIEASFSVNDEHHPTNISNGDGQTKITRNKEQTSTRTSVSVEHETDAREIYNVKDFWLQPKKGSGPLLRTIAAHRRTARDRQQQHQIELAAAHEAQLEVREIMGEELDEYPTNGCIPAARRNIFKGLRQMADKKARIQAGAVARDEYKRQKHPNHHLKPKLFTPKLSPRPRSPPRKITSLPFLEEARVLKSHATTTATTGTGHSSLIPLDTTTATAPAKISLTKKACFPRSCTNASSHSP
jgi:hypothetical protein